jgi:hypothetical protein
MFSFTNSLSCFDEGVAAYLERRLRSGAETGVRMNLRLDSDGPNWVVLSGLREGHGLVRHIFPSSLLLDPGARVELDRVIEVFLACWP